MQQSLYLRGSKESQTTPMGSELEGGTRMSVYGVGVGKKSRGSSSTKISLLIEVNLERAPSKWNRCRFPTGRVDGEGATRKWVQRVGGKIPLGRYGVKFINMDI